MTDYDHLDFNNWVLSDVGDKIVMETTVDGYKYKQVQGLKFFKTLKTDILRPGNLYAFAFSREHHGVFSDDIAAPYGMKSNCFRIALAGDLVER